MEKHKEFQWVSDSNKTDKSVAAPKPDDNLKVLQDRFKNEYANEIFKQENRALKESIKELLTIAERYEPIKEYQEDPTIISRAKSLIQ